LKTLSKHKTKLFVLIIFVLIAVIFLPGKNKRFYGFEFEDGFVNVATAIEGDFANNCENFRTKPYTGKANGEPVDASSFTGHYISYSAYLWSISKVFNIDNPANLHKVGNILLLMISCVISFIICIPKKRNILAALWIATLVSMPFVYVVNSGLIENLSISLGIVSICCLFDTKKNLNILLICVLILSLVKRENLVYVALPFISLPINEWKNIRVLLFLCVLVILQSLINPFYTEGLESNDLNQSTFSLNYFYYQAPAYLGSFFNYMGYLLLLVLVVLSKPSKKSLKILGVWAVLILIYSFHYRNRYSIEVGSISLFETYRYMSNTIPFLWGVLLFGVGLSFLSNIYTKLIFAFSSIIILYFSHDMIINFVSDEEQNYHSINDFIKSQPGELTVLDNFSLISKLNHHNDDRIDVRVLNIRNVVECESDNLFIVNRFNVDSLPEVLVGTQKKLVKTEIEYLYKLE